MKIKLVFDDWRQLGKDASVYNTDLGVKLSSGDLHGGTVFDAEVNFQDKEIEKEINIYWEKYKAYPVFRLILEDK